VFTGTPTGRDSPRAKLHMSFASVLPPAFRPRQQRAVFVDLPSEDELTARSIAARATAGELCGVPGAEAGLGAL
jgi:hypothetical protein